MLPVRTWGPGCGASSQRQPRPRKKAEAWCPQQAAQARSSPGRRAAPRARPPGPAPLQPRAGRALLGGVARCWCACPGPGGDVRGPRVRAAAEERGGAGARLSVTAGGGGGGGRRWWWRRLRLLLFRPEAAAAGERAAGAAAAASVAQAGPLGRGRGVRTTGVLASRRRGSQALRQPARRSVEGPAQCPELGSGPGCVRLRAAGPARPAARTGGPRAPQAREQGRGAG
jgi:hypothetical protein